MDFIKSMSEMGYSTKNNIVGDNSTKQLLLIYIKSEIEILKERQSTKLIKSPKYDRRMWSNSVDGKCELRLKLNNKTVYLGKQNVGVNLIVNDDYDSVLKGMNDILTFIDEIKSEEFIKRKGVYEVYYVNSDNKSLPLYKSEWVDYFEDYERESVSKRVVESDIKTDLTEKFDKMFEEEDKYVETLNQ